MAYVELWKNGKMVDRRSVDTDKARQTLLIRVRGAGKIRLALGQCANLGDYEVRVVEGALGKNELLDVSETSNLTGPEKTESYPHVEGFDIIGRLGKGGMGVVWRAVQLGTGREVALKFLSDSRFNSEKTLKRFEREVAVAAKMEFPNIARVYASGLHRGGYYYAMELINGAHLDQFVREKKLKDDQVLKLMLKVCRAVQHAHKAKVVHRDLKPSNIMVDKDGEPHVLDFGLAKLFTEEDSLLTVSTDGDVVGTLAYMSPEQAAGHEIDCRTDVYSLGVILFNLLTGESPHGLSGSRYDVIHRIVEEDARRPQEVGKKVNGELEALLAKALARDLEARYADAGALADDMDNYLRNEPLEAKKDNIRYVIGKRIRKHGVRALIVAMSLAILVLGYIIVGSTAAMSQKDKAYKAWMSVKGIDPSHGLGKLLNEAEALLKKGDRLLTPSSYLKAMAKYEAVAGRCEEIRSIDGARRKAFDAERDAYDVRKMAVDIYADVWAATLFEKAEGKQVSAKLALEQARFTDAEHLWNEAKDLYSGAQGKAEFMKTVAVAAKKKAQSTAALAQEAGAQVCAASFWNEAVKEANAAEANFAAKDFGKADEKWKAAEKGYVQAKEEANRLEALALSARQETQSAYNRVKESAGAGVSAKSIWDVAIAEEKSAEVDFAGKDFGKAREKWEAAIVKYQQVGQEAARLTQLAMSDKERMKVAQTTAKKAERDYDLAIKPYDTDRLDLYGGPAWKEVMVELDRARQAGDFDEVAAAYTRAKELLPTAVATANVKEKAEKTASLIASAQRLSKSGRHSDALEEVNKALEIDPSCTEASALKEQINHLLNQVSRKTFNSLFLSAQGLKAIRKYEAALLEVSEALKIDPTDANARQLMEQIQRYLPQYSGIDTLRGHTEWIMCMDVSPDGKYLVTGDVGLGGTIILWDLTTSKEVKRFKGHFRSVTSVAFSPDGKQIVSSGVDNTIRVWDVATGRGTQLPPGHKIAVTYVTFTPDGKKIVSGGMDNDIRIWDAQHHTLLKTLKGHLGWVICGAFSSDGTKLATGSCDKTINLWDTTSWKLLKTLNGHKHDVHSVAFIDTDKKIVSASHDKTIRIWNLSSGETLRQIGGDWEYLNAIRLTGDERRLVCASRRKGGENLVEVMDMLSGTPVQMLTGHTDIVTSLAVSHDGRYVISGSRDHTVKVWKVNK